MKTKHKRMACVIAGFIMFLLMFCVIGGMEWGSIPVVKGAILSISCEVVGAFLLWKGGWIRIG